MTPLLAILLILAGWLTVGAMWAIGQYLLDAHVKRAKALEEWQSALNEENKRLHEKYEAAKKKIEEETEGNLKASRRLLADCRKVCGDLENEIRLRSEQIYIDRIRASLPRRAVIKQFYIMGQTVQDRIRESIRLTKEELLLENPAAYCVIFKDVDNKQGNSILSNPDVLMQAEEALKLEGLYAKVNPNLGYTVNLMIGSDKMRQIGEGFFEPISCLDRVYEELLGRRNVI